MVNNHDWSEGTWRYENYEKNTDNIDSRSRNDGFVAAGVFAEKVRKVKIR